MTDVLTARPALSELYEFIAKVKGYPISIESLVDTARRLNASDEVLKFYAGFRPRLTFRDKDELLGCSEQVEIMRTERPDMPQEIERSPEEY